jgi:hypothetical protein
MGSEYEPDADIGSGAIPQERLEASEELVQIAGMRVENLMFGECQQLRG